jgi:hypothetical protein
MEDIAAIYLAHLNPLTNAHEKIISNLKQKGYHVYVFPVRFLKDGNEVNTRSFPFSYELRRQMVVTLFGDSVTVLPDYTFHAPFSKYLPPLFSSRSWNLRKQIVGKITERRFVSYTGDAAERLMLKIYRLKPLKANRMELSASVVKERFYREATEGRASSWQDNVPEPVVAIIKNNWHVVEKFARMQDDTKRVMGMKFPLEGYN